MSGRRRREREELERELAVATAGLAAARADSDRLGAAIHRLPDAVVVVDAAGRTVARNEAAERFRDPRHADAVAAEAITALLRTALDGDVAEQELEFHGPPNAVLLVRAEPLQAGEERIGAVATVHDVTELRRVESVRRDFVANVSHELKTPIGALALLAETMSESGDEETNRQLSERLLREADRLTRIVDDLLDLSLIEARDAPSRENVPARVVVEEAAERVRPLAVARAIPLEDTLPPDELIIACDPAQVVSAVTNLLDNAIKYSDAGARVELSVHEVDGNAVIEVRDRGMGIPTKDLERIFERFYRVDRARSRETGGTGLGLAIVRRVAEAHGGEVSVESREGEGSTFRLSLPIASGAVHGIAQAS